jgi:lysophospholipase L1-like esterase
MIHCFGDSWVAGIGTEWEPGKGRIPMEDRYNEKFEWWKVYKKYSWPGQLQELLNNKLNVKNYGQPGFSNNDIYKDIIEKLWTKKIKKNDLVIVSFSSIIRQPLPFFYVRDEHDGFINYSNTCFLHYKSGFNTEKLHWIENITNKKLQNITDVIYRDYIVNRFNYNFLYEISMQYICNLQIYFEELGVDYVFVNAFENNVSKNVKFYDRIKQDKWILFDYTLQEYLVDKSKNFDKRKGYSVWEDDELNVEKNSDGPHPNRIGYKIIAELIHKEIKNKI